jgi:hypothetical protein
VVGLATVGGAVGWAAVSGDHSPAQGTAAAMPSGEAIDQASSALDQQVEIGLPRPVLPADQREAWVSMWQTVADCMHQHGVASFPDAPATFGDGKTPPPVIRYRSGTDLDPESPSAQKATAECQFDYSRLSPDVFRAALANAG